MKTNVSALAAVTAIAAALLGAAVAVAPDPARASVWRNAPWQIPPSGVRPQITITYLATGGGGIACYGSPPNFSVGDRDTWWCYTPGNSIAGYLHAGGQEFTLFLQNMTLKCRYFFVADMEQPRNLPQGVYGWNGRAECVGEGPYNIAVRWSQ